MRLFVIPICAILAALPARGLPAAIRTAGSAKEVSMSNLHYYDPAPTLAQPKTLDTDVCIYGGTSAGIAAALQLSRMGESAVILEPSGRAGGMSSGGLSDTDIGNKDAIGGISREFYKRVGRKYGEPEEWRFEPHVAEQVFGDMLRESKTPIYYHEFLKSADVEKTPTGSRLISITLESGLTVRAHAFIDATYEGDLMAKAGVSFHVGRESNDVFHETLNGVQVHKTHQFDLPVDPYVQEGDPASGLLPGIEAGSPGNTGDGDKRIQAYNFRLCVTKDPANRIPFEKPDGYNPQNYVILARYLAKGWPETEVFKKFDTIRGDKADKNNHGAVSTDYIGGNFAFPETDYKTRETIYQAHVSWQRGLMWFMGNDQTVPESIRVKWNQWGLCKDEFSGTGGWPAQLYVRESRRMMSDHVMTEHNCRGQDIADDSVGLAAYTMDSHNCERFVLDGHVRNEGDVQVGGMPPYPISYRSIIPKRGECENLLVPVCLSASHIAYGSIRMEPVFMILGQSAATAAAMSLDDHVALQALPYPELRARLLADGQLLEHRRR